MLAKPIERSRTTEGDEETADGPILDLSVSPVAKMIARGRERGYVTHDELNGALPPGETSADRIEDTMTLLSELGISVTEGEESETDTEEGRPEAASAAAGHAVTEERKPTPRKGVRKRLRPPLHPGSALTISGFPAIRWECTCGRWEARRFSPGRARSRSPSASKRGGRPCSRVSARVR